MIAKGFIAGEVITSFDVRDDAIARVVEGRSFADVGGLYNMGEKCSVAAKYGAASVTMIDISASSDRNWAALAARLLERGVQNFTPLSIDIVKYNGPAFDVVHSSGVLYHLPNPLPYLKKLADITREYLILSSVVTPERIENGKGVYQLPPSGAIFVPALSDSERAILAEYWGLYGTCMGITEPYTFKYEDFTPWWFLPTRACFTSMAKSCGLEVIAEGTYAMNSVVVLVLRPTPQTNQ